MDGTPPTAFGRACVFGAMLTSLSVVRRAALPLVDGAKETEEVDQGSTWIKSAEPTNKEANSCVPQHPHINFLSDFCDPNLGQQSGLDMRSMDFLEKK